MHYYLEHFSSKSYVSLSELFLFVKKKELIMVRSESFLKSVKKICCEICLNKQIMCVLLNEILENGSGENALLNFHFFTLLQQEAKTKFKHMVIVRF